MEIFENENKVLVKVDSKSFEFEKLDQFTLKPLDNSPTGQIIEKLKSEGFSVDLDSQNFSFNLRGPYERGEAATEFGIDINDDRFESLFGIMKYGVSVTVEVEPDGTTKLSEVNGSELDNKVEI